MYHFTALITCLAILFYFFTAVQVTRARMAHGIQARRYRATPTSNGYFACR